MIRKYYIRTLINVGGSLFIAIPPAFIRRHKLFKTEKIIVQEDVDKLQVLILNEQNLKMIAMDATQRIERAESKRVGELRKKYKVDVPNNKKEKEIAA